MTAEGRVCSVCGAEYEAAVSVPYCAHPMATSGRSPSPQEVVADFFRGAFLTHADGCDQPQTCIHAQEDRDEAYRLAGVFLHMTLVDHGLALVTTPASSPSGKGR